MTKKKVIEGIDNLMLELEQRKKIIESIPIGVNLLLTGLDYTYRNGEYENTEFQAFASILSFNKESVRFRVIATNNRLKKDPASIGYQNIKEWRPLKIEDLPMGLSWTKFPSYEKMLMKGALNNQKDLDTFSLHDLNLSVKHIQNVSVGQSFPIGTVKCPSCSKDVSLHSPYTHICYSCGYSFKSKEKWSREGVL